ncbi:hypothetical protein AOQ84DRAFT_379290 [Glonium stellatum]|uniref:DUF7708 domain-containing protein n=1 Tax=Glonium stellatum TaxID=574774 RepID=A0A8E2EVL0_9PEZI|nr:hypothetical protein AOQ84DRAFT_379290 [Glonium stellatum]
MEQYGKVIEVFLNNSEFISFIWARPRKVSLAGILSFPIRSTTLIIDLSEVASTFTEAFDELLGTYNDISESLPMLAQYESLFQEKGYMGKVLELIYVDILKFHLQAYKYFKQRVWKQVFRACWKTLRSQFRPVLEDLRRHKGLVKT